jgi:hypothetical protein
VLELQDQVLAVIDSIDKEFQNLADNVLNLLTGTTILDASDRVNGVYPDILRRVSLTAGTKVDIVCPDRR